MLASSSRSRCGCCRRQAAGLRQPGRRAGRVRPRGPGDIEIDLVEQFTDIGGLAADVGKGVAFFIDEMQDLDPEDVSALCASCHVRSRRRGRSDRRRRRAAPSAGGALRFEVLLREAVSLPTHRPTPCEAADQAPGRPGCRRGVCVRSRGARGDVCGHRRLPHFIQAYGKAVDVAPTSPISAEDIRVAAPEAESSWPSGSSVTVRARDPRRARVSPGRWPMRPWSGRTEPNPTTRVTTGWERAQRHTASSTRWTPSRPQRGG